MSAKEFSKERFKELDSEFNQLIRMNPMRRYGNGASGAMGAIHRSMFDDEIWDLFNAYDDVKVCLGVVRTPSGRERVQIQLMEEVIERRIEARCPAYSMFGASLFIKLAPNVWTVDLDRYNLAANLDSYWDILLGASITFGADGAIKVRYDPPGNEAQGPKHSS